MEVMVETESTVEIAKLDKFLLMRYGTPGINLIRGLVRALQSQETGYGK
jgi:hypothetical protein